jgi:hypothetical protein
MQARDCHREWQGRPALATADAAVAALEHPFHQASWRAATIEFTDLELVDGQAACSFRQRRHRLVIRHQRGRHQLGTSVIVTPRRRALSALYTVGSNRGQTTGSLVNDCAAAPGTDNRPGAPSRRQQHRRQRVSSMYVAGGVPVIATMTAAIRACSAQATDARG